MLSVKVHPCVGCVMCICYGYGAHGTEESALCLLQNKLHGSITNVNLLFAFILHLFAMNNGCDFISLS